ncbi:MAG TPA: NB-ARC domain-containing protein [Trichocoleus sp.]|jgi:hypothetical protein
MCYHQVDRPEFNFNMVEDTFVEAAGEWDLDRLYADLGEVKRVFSNSNRRIVALTDVEKACLRGLLCGYSPTEIANTLKRDITGLRVDLSRGMYEYIEILIEQRPRNWQQVSFLLQKAGYRLNSTQAKQTSPLSSIRQDFGEMIDVSQFYGRSIDLDHLQTWIVNQACRAVAITGMGGIGKTTLAAKFLQDGLVAASPFAKVGWSGIIWRSLRYAPPVTETLTELIQFVTQSSESPSGNLDQQISYLLSHLRQQRFLIVLDDWENVLQEGKLAGYCAQEHQGYGRLLQRLAAEHHKSCLLLISREQPIELSSCLGGSSPVHLLKLKGLKLPDAQALLIEQGFPPEEPSLPELIEVHRGNPAALKLTAITIQDLFDGKIPHFLAQTSLILGDVLLNLLEQQLTRLSTIEQTVIFWLAIAGRAVSITALKTDFAAEDRSDLLSALESLRRRSLIEKTVRIPIGDIPDLRTKETLFALEPVVMKYVVQQLIDRACQSIDQVIQTKSIAQLGILRSHRLVAAPDADEINFYQSQRILHRIGDRLNKTLEGDVEQVKLNLQAVLTWIQEQNSHSVGYAEMNVMELLKIISTT